VRWLVRISNAVLTLERLVISALAAALVILILLNVVTRAAGAAIFWVDELAIYTMIWMAFIGASVMLKMRMAVAVTLITELFPARIKSAVGRLVDAIVLFFAAVLLVLCWQWYDPFALVRSGFDFERFAQETFKFIYTEPTNTIGIAKYRVWLVVPLMAACMTLHAAANLLERSPAGPDDRLHV